MNSRGAVSSVCLFRKGLSWFRGFSIGFGVSGLVSRFQDWFRVMWLNGFGDEFCEFMAG